MSSLLATVFLLAVAPAFAAVNLAVGPQACQPGYTHFATIQAAVNAAPLNGVTTILVCPGIYPEQVQIIGKKITLKGVSYNGSDSAIIEPPTTGLVANATSTFDGSAIEAMVLVQNTTAANIEYLTIDGTNNLTTCGQDPVGIFYQNASGTITRNNVLHVQVIDGFGCQGGLGIYVESGATTGLPNPSNEANSTVSITYNNVQDYDKNGITANGTLTGTNSNVGVTIKYNTVIGAGATPDNAQNGIQLWGANGIVSSNVIDGDWYTVPGSYAAAGILVLQSTSPVVQSNTISNTNVGIYLESINPDDTDNATISGNTITATHQYDGIVLCANKSTATGNTINVADESGVNVAACGDPAPTDTVQSNTINGACAGILIAPPALATPSGTFYNVTTPVLTTSSDTCATPLVKKHNGTVPHRTVASPARRKLSH
jgi:parallel beta-helix repeat protein